MYFLVSDKSAHKSAVTLNPLLAGYCIQYPGSVHVLFVKPVCLDTRDLWNNYAWHLRSQLYCITGNSFSLFKKTKTLFLDHFHNHKFLELMWSLMYFFLSRLLSFSFFAPRTSFSPVWLKNLFLLTRCHWDLQQGSITKAFIALSRLPSGRERDGALPHQRAESLGIFFLIWLEWIVRSWLGVKDKGDLKRQKAGVTIIEMHPQNTRVILHAGSCVINLTECCQHLSNTRSIFVRQSY